MLLSPNNDGIFFFGGNPVHGVDADDGEEEEKQKLNGLTQTEDHVVTKTLENRTSDTDTSDDNGETFIEKNDISGRTGSISAIRHGDTNIGSLERGGVIDTITGHTNTVTGDSLKDLDDVEFMFRENLGHTVGILDLSRKEFQNEKVKKKTLNDFAILVAENIMPSKNNNFNLNKFLSNLFEDFFFVGVVKDFRSVHVIVHVQLAESFFGDGFLITGDHLNLDAEHAGFLDGFGGIVTGGIVKLDETGEFPTAVLPDGNTDGTETTLGGFEDGGGNFFLDFFEVVRHTEDNLGCTLGNLECFAFFVVDDGAFGTFGDGIERDEGGLFVLLDRDIAVLEFVSDNAIDRIQFVTSKLGGEAAELDDIFCGEG